MKPHSHDVGVARAFDCFCKKVLRNEARDYQDALARKRNREVNFLDMSDAEIANVLNMVRRSVAYRRTSTLKLLKNLMGGENR